MTADYMNRQVLPFVVAGLRVPMFAQTQAPRSFLLSHPILVIAEQVGLPEIAILVAFSSVVVLLVTRKYLKEQKLEREANQRRMLREKEVEDERRRIASRDKAEREATANEYKELADEFAVIVTLGTPVWSELNRAAKALHGEFASIPYLQVVEYNLLEIMKCMSVANDGVPDGLGRLHQAVFGRIDSGFNFSVAKCETAVERWEHSPVKLPVGLEEFQAVEGMNGGNLSSSTATAYLAFLDASAKYFRSTMAVETVKGKYIKLLKPFLSNGQEASCPNCSDFYGVLRLQPKATVEQIKSAYRDLVQIYHPDRFNGNDRLFRTAQEEMKKVNAAYEHIMSHFEQPT